VVGGLANDPKGAELLRGEWGGRLDKTLLIRTAREAAQQLAASLPAARDDDSGPQSMPSPPVRGQSARTPSAQQPPYPPAGQQQYPPTGQQQYPQGPGPQAPQQYPPRQQRGAGGRHSTLAQPAGAAPEAGDGRWTTP